MAITQPYSTRQKLENRLSQVGVDLRIDDDISTATECLNEATIEVQGYCLRSYSDAQLLQSNWVKLKTTDIATYFLCTRRANDVPGSVKDRYDKAIADLEKVMMAAMTIPDAAQRGTNAPTLTNQRVRLWPIPHIVSTDHNSTGTPTGYPRSEDPTDYDPST